MNLSSISAPAQSDARGNVKPNISIVVPTLNEGPRIELFLDHLRERAPTAELILVNAAGSESVSPSMAARCDRVLTSRRGRAAQMNAGAEVARGDVLWFLHADCEVPRNCLAEIGQVLADARTVGGCFRIRFPRRQLIYRVSDTGGNLAVEVFGRCYGDHGIFCRRADFSAVGGYPDLPLFEDAEFYRRLRQRGRTHQIGSCIIPSPRRYDAIGPYRLAAVYLLLSLLYILRLPIPLLARIYDRICISAAEPPRLAPG